MTAYSSVKSVTQGKTYQRIRTFVFENSMFFVLLLLMGAMGLVSDKFFTTRNLTNILIQNCTVTIVALGATFVLISGGIDLSIGSVVGMTAILTCGLTQYNGFQEWQAILFSLILSICVGIMNGWIITRFRLEPVVVTLGMWYFVQGLFQNYIQSRVPTAPQITTYLGSENIYGFPIIVLITILMVILGHLILSKTVLGRWAYAMGGNPVSAKMSGVPILKARMIIFSLSAFYAFVSSILMSGRIYAVDANAGSGIVFLAPAAAVVGGTSLFGGRGRAINAVIGALIMGVISNGLNLTNLSFFWQQVAVGAAILIAVTIDALQRRRD